MKLRSLFLSIFAAQLTVSVASAQDTNAQIQDARARCKQLANPSNCLAGVDRAVEQLRQRQAALQQERDRRRQQDSQLLDNAERRRQADLQKARDDSNARMAEYQRQRALRDKERAAELARTRAQAQTSTAKPRTEEVVDPRGSGPSFTFSSGLSEYNCKRFKKDCPK